MKQKYYLTLTFLLFTLLTLTACNGSSGGTQRINSSSGQAKAAPAEPQAASGPGDPAKGKELFAGTCSACHGLNGEGIPGLGKDMTASEFIADKTDTELIEFIKIGRDPSDPLNTTGVAMPPKGGNPSLNDEKLQDIVAYIRSLHK